MVTTLSPAVDLTPETAPGTAVDHPGAGRQAEPTESVTTPAARRTAIHHLRGVLRLVGSRSGGAPALADMTPSPTPRRVKGTLTPRHGRRSAHDPLGSGDPRLVYYPAPPWQGGPRHQLSLRRGVTTVGGAPEDDLFASGMQPGHLRIERDPTTDRHEVVPVPVALTLVDGQPLEVPVVLRTGTVLRAGDLEFSYVREQYADQGRPNGGRQAGEL